MDRAELAAKYNGELVGGRVAIVLNGKKQYITDTTEDGNWIINLLGRELEEASRQKGELQEVKPVKPTKGIPQKA